MQSDRRLVEAKAIPISEVIDRLAIPDLKRSGRELIGPCPVCGGRDRFGANLDRDVFNCRTCGGGDGLALVQLVQSCDFKAALSWLVGDLDVSLDPAEVERRRKRAERQRQERDSRAERERQKSIAAARAVWAEGQPAEGSLVVDYLLARGFPKPFAHRPPDVLRFHSGLKYMVKDHQPYSKGWLCVHTGPAMLAKVTAPDGQLIGVHRTWIDPARPKGKPVIQDCAGEQLQVKKILGSKKGGAIRLTAGDDFKCLVMGEGIETTMTALVAGGGAPGFGFWSGVDLGNMAGRRVLRGKGMRYRGIPDLEDGDAFLPPPWINRLVFVQDGDSEPKSTRAKLLSGLRRAKHFNPSLRIQIAHAGEGIDLNDILLGG